MSGIGRRAGWARAGWALAWVVAASLSAAHAARADDLDIPGLASDASRFQALLQKKFPAGGTDRQRAQAQAAASQADNRSDYTAASVAWADRAGQRDPGSEMWLGLARDLLRRPAPDAPHALDAAWVAYRTAQDANTPDQNAVAGDALLVMRDALVKLDRPVAELDVLTFASSRSPDDVDLRTALARRRQQIGLLLRGVRTESESFPASACLTFVGIPGGQPDFHPGDWVKLSPAIADAATTLDDDALCIHGLPVGATTHVTLRAGMPGHDGTHLVKEQAIDVAMPDRQPRVVLDGNHYLQAKSAAAEIALASVNMPSVTLEIVRISERAAQPFLILHPPGGDLVGTDIESLRNTGTTVWTGTTGIPAFRRNDLIQTRLPLPAGATAEPGMYVVYVQAADASARRLDNTSAAQLILRTDLAPTTWQGVDGLLVQVRGYASALPKASVAVALIAADNDVLATATTDPQGQARFAAPLLHGTNGAAPSAVHLRGPHGDATVLNLTRPAFDLSDRGVAGRAIVEGTDAFIWLDRDIFRPGETVHAMALPRDPAGNPVTKRFHAVVTRPNAQVFADIVATPGPDGALSLPIVLPGGAALGTWKVSLRPTPDGTTISEAAFQVDAFVPARLAVDLGKPAEMLTPGRTASLPVTVRFMYGAPGSGLSGKADISVAANPKPFEAYADYKFGLADEKIPGQSFSVDLPVTDAQGATSVPIDLSTLPDVTGALQANVHVAVHDPAGRPVNESVELPIRPAAPLLGVKVAAPDGVFRPGQDADFDVVAIGPDGKPVAMPHAKLTVVRQVPDWRLVVRRGVASYETQWRDEPVDSKVVDVPGTAPLHLSYKVGFGRYRLEIVQSGQGLAAASVVFNAGWEVSENADVPPRVRVATDRKAYTPGDTAHVRIDAPYAGPAALVVVSNHVHEVRSIDIPAGGTTVDVAVGSDWGPGAYVAVHAFRPIEGQPEGHAVSERAIGIAWIGIDPATRNMPVTIETPIPYRPGTTAIVLVHAPAGATLTLAAVDEGILRLTKFVSPDPLGWFTGQRALAVDIRDEWGRLLRPAEGELAALREGGGGDNEDTPPPPPQRLVSLFVGPVQAGPDGVARIPLNLPDFNGQLRLMVVAWDGNRVGAASSDVLVRDKLVAEALLPRFLAPGDTARFGVSLQNVELPAGPVHVALGATGALTLDGPAAFDQTLAAGQRVIIAGNLRAGESGAGESGAGAVTVDVTGPAGFSVHHALKLSVHPARPRTTIVSQSELSPGQSVRVVPGSEAFVPGTWRASLSLGTAVRYNVAALVQALSDFPLSCIEQGTSRGLPLTVLPNGPTAGVDREGRLGRAVEQALDKQRYDGGFAMWSADGDAEPWLSAYATEFLLRAEKSGATVPKPAMDGALKYLSDELAREDDSPDSRAARVYAAYVLTMAGQAPATAIRAIEAAGAEQLPTPLARAQLGAALVRIAEPDQGAKLLRAAFTEPARNPARFDEGSSLREQLAIAVLISESGTKTGGTKTVGQPELIAALPGSNLDPDALSTQEQAWAATAGAVLAGSGSPLSATVDGTAVKGPIATIALTDVATVHNTGTGKLWSSVVVTGVPRAPLPAARHLMAVRRNFFTMTGEPITPDKLVQNIDFVMLVEGGADDAQAHQMMLTAGLPAGWEIAGHLSGGKTAGMDWLGALTEPATQAARDDRVVIAFDLPAADAGAKTGFRTAVLLHATTPGEFEYPGLELTDMYRPALFARQGTVRVTVLPAP